MINYRAQVFPIVAENGSVSWGAIFPDLSCVVGGGDTPEEAIKEAYENLQYYLNDVGVSNLPQPTNPYAKEYSGKFMVRISKKLHRDLSICADNEGLSLNAFCAEALARCVERKSIEQREKPTNTLQFYQYNQIIVGEYQRGTKW